MNQWPYVIASYIFVLIGTVIVIAASYTAMRRAETKADGLRKRK